MNGERGTGQLRLDGLGTHQGVHYNGHIGFAVRKSGRQLDVDNVGKTIVHAFCSSRIARGRSSHLSAGLNPDDTFDLVRALQEWALEVWTETRSRSRYSPASTREL